MGLDLALGGTGIALPDGTTLRHRPQGPDNVGYRRHADIALTVLAIIGTAKPDLVVVEDYAPHSIGINSTIAAGELQGVIRVHFTLRRIAWRAVPPSTLKKYATGRGTATKPEMVAAAIEAGARPGLSHDEADAWHLRRYGLEHL